MAEAKRLQWRTAKSHRHFIGAVLRGRFADLVGVARVATTHTDEVLIGSVVGHRSNHYSITGDVDVGRGYWGLGEIDRVSFLHPAPMRTERDHARRRGRCCCWRWRRGWCRSGKRVDFVIPSDVNVSPSHHAGGAILKCYRH